MDPETITIVAVFVLPMYWVQFQIWRQIGKYDNTCQDTRQLRKEVNTINQELGIVPEEQASN